MAHYGGMKYKKGRKGGSTQSNGPGSWSYGPALSTNESNIKAKKRR